MINQNFTLSFFEKCRVSSVCSSILTLLILAITVNASAIGRENAATEACALRKKLATSGELNVNLYRKVGTITYNFRRVTATLTSQLDMPKDAYLVIVDMEIYNSGHCPVRMLMEQFQIITDKGVRSLPVTYRSNFLLDGKQRATCRLAYVLRAGDFSHRPRLVSTANKNLEPLELEKLLLTERP